MNKKHIIYIIIILGIVLFYALFHYDLLGSQEIKNQKNQKAQIITPVKNLVEILEKKNQPIIIDDKKKIEIEKPKDNETINIFEKREEKPPVVKKEKEEKEEKKKEKEKKPKIVFLTTTFCPACQIAVPKYETEIWEVYKEEIDIFVNVLDKQKFPVENIPQGFKEELTFKTLTGEVCNYIPSFVILNKKSEIVKKSCGGGGNIQKIIEKLDYLIQ